MRFEDALEAFVEAIVRAGLEPPLPPASTESLEQLEAAIAPMRLPADVRRFWATVDAATVRALPYPAFINPDFALTSFRMAREEARAHQPLCLLTIAYESFQCMSVELDTGAAAGGALFEWRLEDGGFERRFNRLADWLAYLVDLLDAGLTQPSRYANGPALLVPGPDRADEVRARRPKPPPHPVHAADGVIDRDILEWPEHWQRSSGVMPEDIALRGATHTIAEVLASAEEALRATVVGEVVDLIGSGHGSTVRVDDRTASITIRCPVETTLLGPRMRDWFEFDIDVAPGARVQPADPAAASAGIDDPTEALAATLMARYGGPPGAIARAVRRAAPPER